MVHSLRRHSIKGIAIKLFEILVHAVFPALVFTLCSNITLKNLLDEIRRPSKLLRISAVSILVIPAVTAVIFKVFNADIVVTAIALIAAIAPGDSFALLEAESKKANITLAAAIMAWLCILMPFTVPLWLGVLSKTFHLTLKASPLEIFTTVAPLTVIPLALGIFFREFSPKLSDVLKKITGLFFRFSVIIVSLVCLAYASKGLSHYTAGSVMAIFLAVTAAMFLGYYCGLPDRKDRLTSALSASLGNFALIILVAHISYPEAHIAPQAIVFVLIRWLIIMFWYVLFRFSLRRSGEIF